jgi:hypothetical protein
LFVKNTAALPLAGAFLLTAVAGAAEENTSVAVHGFGNIVYGNTDGNEYAVGNEDGEYAHGEMAISFLADPADRVHIAVQTALEQEHGGVWEPDLDFAFAEWRFSDALKLRAGRVKAPFGLYTEIFDVGTLRPLAYLPQGIYGPAALVTEGFNGAGLTGYRRVGRWALQYDLYFGDLNLDVERVAVESFPPGGEGEQEGEEPAEADEEGEAGEEPSGEEEGEGLEIVRNAIGGRLTLETPVSGLRVGVSAYSGSEGEHRHTTVGAHFEAIREPWWLRAEYAHLTESGELDSDALYVEVARRLGPRWQAAARYDWMEEDGESLEGLPSALRRSRDVGIGLNYWFSPQFVLKVSYHNIDGNRFARPEETTSLRELDEKTNLVAVAAQFSF